MIICGKYIIKVAKRSYHNSWDCIEQNLLALFHYHQNIFPHHLLMGVDCHKVSFLHVYKLHCKSQKYSIVPNFHLTCKTYIVIFPR